ncbi:unnamed protein product [Effrenium voratum]|uniref:EF-hand domain-containing protein n=1 Tax=Effrenium voratum TaxID=2562239 RepID=A0AA36IST8_9DINO|nr:unnamed protein product [Effrenium voratum]
MSFLSQWNELQEAAIQGDADAERLASKVLGSGTQTVLLRSERLQELMRGSGVDDWRELVARMLDWEGFCSTRYLETVTHVAMHMEGTERSARVCNWKELGLAGQQEWAFQTGGVVSPVVALAIGMVGADGIVRNGMISGRENWSEWGTMGRPASLLLSGVAWDYTKDEGRRRISTAEVDVSSSRPRILPQSLGGRPWTSLRENRRHVFQFDYCPTHTARVDASRRAPKREDRLERAGSCSGRFQRSAGCITSSNGFKMNYSVPQLEERSLLGAGWTRSSGSKGALKKGPGPEPVRRNGWLRNSMESSEASELGEAMRALFSAYDFKEDGRIDLEEYVQGQQIIADVLGESFERDTATQYFYAMENSKLGKVSFVAFFRGELRRLQEQSELGLGPGREEWPQKVAWLAQQITLGQQRLRLKCSLELGQLARERQPDTARLRELRMKRQGELEGRLILRGVVSNLGQLAVSVLRATAPGYCPSFCKVSTAGLQHAAVKLAPFTIQAKLKAEAGREARLVREGGASFEVPVGLLQKDGKDFSGLVSFAAAVEMKDLDELLPWSLGLAADGDIVMLQPVLAVYAQLHDDLDGKPLQLKGGARIQAGFSGKVELPKRSPALWQLDSQCLWEELLLPVAVDDLEVPLPLFEQQEKPEAMTVAALFAQRRQDEVVLNLSDTAEAELLAALGEPQRPLRKNRFYQSLQAQALVPSLRRMAASITEDATVTELISGKSISQVDSKALDLLALEQLCAAWAQGPGLLEMREALSKAGDVAQAFLLVAEAQARRKEAARVQDLLRIQPQKAATFSRINELLEGFNGQERSVAEHLASDPQICRQARVEQIREAVLSLLPGACPSSKEISDQDQAAFHQGQKRRAAAELELEAAQASARQLQEELEIAKADKKKKQEAARLAEELEQAQAQVEELKEKLQAESATSPEQVAEILASEQKQLERSTRGSPWQDASQHKEKEGKHSISLPLAANCWSCLAAPKVFSLPGVRQGQVCSLVLGRLHTAEVAIVSAKPTRPGLAERCASVEPEGHFSLLVAAGEEFHVKVLRDDLQTVESFGPFTAESPGNILHVGVLGESVAGPAKVTLSRYLVTRRGTSKTMRSSHSSDPTKS